MKIDKKFPAIIYAGCGFSLLLVILVRATSLYFSERQKQKEHGVEHTYQVPEKVHTVYHHPFEAGMDKQRFRSHEFRTPLSSILLSTSLIEKYIKAHDTANAAKHSQKIRTTVGNMNNILEDFLSLEKLNAGKISPVFRPFDLIDLCQDITKEMQHIAKPGQTLRFEHAGTENIVNLDKSLVKNAIINLIANAVKYAGGSAAIILNADISSDHVAISIKDNGIGIAENDQKELFTPFYRVNNTGNIPGTGLGLSIVSRYVNLMNGKLSFWSVPNKETCFEMSFSIAS